MTDVTKKDGGPAFPRPATFKDFDRDEFVDGSEQGMSLRDWFAGQAMAAALYQGLGTDADRRVFMEDDNPCGIIAELAYAQADAMLKERGGQDE